MSDKYDVLMSEEILKCEFIQNITYGNVIRCGFFKKGSNLKNYESGVCDMSQLDFLLIWMDNIGFDNEYECKFIIINKSNPQIAITLFKSMLSDEIPSFEWDFENIDNSNSIKIYDILCIIGITLINNDYLTKFLPPFRSIS